MAWNGSQFVAVGRQYAWTSKNGTAWTRNSKPLDAQLSKVIWTGKLTDLAAHNGTVVAAGVNGGKVVTLQSTNLTKWTPQAVTPGSGRTYSTINVQWVKDRFLIAADHIYSSANGLQWSVVKGQYDQQIQPHDAGDTLSRVVWTGQDYRLMSSNRVGVSKDLKSWSFYEHDRFYTFNIK